MKFESNIKNYTPHEITLIGDDGKPLISFPSCGVARCQVTRERTGNISVFVSNEGVKKLHLIPINSTNFGQVEGLPEPNGENLFIVSLAVAQAMSEKRSDLLVTDDTVRDENGKIVGCRAFARV